MLDVSPAHLRHDRFARVEKIRAERKRFATPRVFNGRIAAGEGRGHGPTRNVPALEGVRLKLDEAGVGDRSYFVPRHWPRRDVGNLRVPVQSRSDERDGLRPVFLQQRESHVIEIPRPIIERQHDGSR
jgi:hypothetical protein